jgi:hypothetical protein
LVQPVLDQYCVDCHAKHPKKSPRLDAELVKYRVRGRGNVPTTYFASYVSLAPEWGFYDYGGKDQQDPKWYRTTPGEFGALASKLYPLLMKDHYGVKLLPADLRRITLWLDSCSLFYGVYEPAGGVAQLHGEIAQPSLQ